jgi:hypothetical protein
MGVAAVVAVSVSAEVLGSLFASGRFPTSPVVAVKAKIRVILNNVFMVRAKIW